MNQIHYDIIKKTPLPTKNAFWQVWLKLAQWFWRKVENVTSMPIAQWSDKLEVNIKSVSNSSANLIIYNFIYMYKMLYMTIICGLGLLDNLLSLSGLIINFTLLQLMFLFLSYATLFILV